MSKSHSSPPPARLLSLDAYRGFVMLAMASAGFGIRQVARQFPDSTVWQQAAYQFSHVEWIGCAFWDMIQPSFMFMVGVAMPFSYASRVSRGDSYGRIFAHTVYRSVALILLGIFIFSNGQSQTRFRFDCVLTQIGLGYAFVFLLIGRGAIRQFLAASAILIGYGLLFYFYPPDSLDPTQLAAQTNEPLTGFFAHWNIHTSAAGAFDRWFLNLFPRSEPLVFASGGYQTLNFIPSMATMIFGLMAGELLRSELSPTAKLLRLLTAGAVCLLGGLVLGEFACPIVKKIWTPSWAVFSTGWTLWMLAGFYWVIDVIGLRRWAFPLIVVGMNSIAMYCLAELMSPWLRMSLRTHFGKQAFSGAYGPIIESVSVLFLLWLILLWMYRRNIFVRL